MMEEANNEVTIGPNGIVMVVYRGDQDADSVLKTAEEAAQALDRLAQTGRPLRSIVDMRAIGTTRSSARAAGFKALKNIRGGRLVIVGASPFNKYAIKFIIAASAKKPQLEFMSDLEAAAAWLLKTRTKAL